MKLKNDFLLFTLILFTLLSLSLNSYSQEEFSIKSILSKKDTNFHHIDIALRKINRDTVALKDFINKAKEINYYEGQTIGYNTIGISYRNQSKYQEAKKYHDLALLSAEKCKNSLFKAVSLNMLGVVFRRLDQVKEAIDLHKSALELIEKSGDTTINTLKSKAVSHNSIGNIYLTLNQDDLAENEFLQSLELEKRVNNKRGLAINYQNLGYILENKDSLILALEYYKKSLYYNEQINSVKGKIICKNSIGQIYIKLGDIKEAHRIISPTVIEAEELGDQYFIAETYTNMGWINLILKNYAESELYLKKALELSKTYSFPAFLTESNKHLSELYQEKKDYKNAYFYSKEYNTSKESYLNEQNQKYVADLIIKYEADKKINRIALLEKENELVSLRLTDNKKLFIALIVFSSMLLLVLYFMYRQNKLKSEKEILNLEQTMLRSKMNPHFIFNSLNSIKLYIINNEKDKAVFYLNKFSKLIRTILNSTTEKVTSLKEELQTMELYMNIENIRFENKISFNIEIEEDLDTSLIRLPSMILQPFLENSIWHGLSGKKGNKEIIIRVLSLDNNLATIEIEDNGIGRLLSFEQNSKKTINRKSIGLELTEKRLDNFYHKLAKGYSLEIVDLKNENKSPIGTKVILIIPHSKQKELISV